MEDASLEETGMEGSCMESTGARGIPARLRAALRPVTLVAGHYGVGKTNFALNLALNLAREGAQVTLVDLDIVNPYFRASEQRRVLEAGGVQLVAPVFAEAGTSLDVPSLTGRIAPAIEQAGEGCFTVIDVGGDDAGSVAVGRFSRQIAAGDYAMLAVANRFRNLVADPRDALANLREIEAASRLAATAVVDNAHLKGATDAAAIRAGFEYARELAQLAGLPLVAVTAPAQLLEAPAASEGLPSAHGRLRLGEASDCPGEATARAEAAPVRDAQAPGRADAVRAQDVARQIGSFVESDYLYPVTMYVRTPWE